MNNYIDDFKLEIKNLKDIKSYTTKVDEFIKNYLFHFQQFNYSLSDVSGIFKMVKVGENFDFKNSIIISDYYQDFTKILNQNCFQFSEKCIVKTNINHLEKLLSNLNNFFDFLNKKQSKEQIYRPIFDPKKEKLILKTIKKKVKHDLNKLEELTFLIFEKMNICLMRINHIYFTESYSLLSQLKQNFCSKSIKNYSDEIYYKNVNKILDNLNNAIITNNDRHI